MKQKYWPVIIILVYLWQSTGYTSIVYYASVVGFDKGYYEAAELEGAGPWQKIRYITLSSAPSGNHYHGNVVCGKNFFIQILDCSTRFQ